MKVFWLLSSKKQSVQPLIDRNRFYCNRSRAESMKQAKWELVRFLSVVWGSKKSQLWSTIITDRPIVRCLLTGVKASHRVSRAANNAVLRKPFPVSRVSSLHISYCSSSVCLVKSSPSLFEEVFSSRRSVSLTLSDNLLSWSAWHHIHFCSSTQWREEIDFYLFSLLELIYLFVLSEQNRNRYCDSSHNFWSKCFEWIQIYLCAWWLSAFW